VSATVYKYSVDLVNELELLLPVGAEPLTAQLQHGRPVMWARVDPNAPGETRRFTWRGTGYSADGTGKYIGTVQNDAGTLVFHLFEAA
jgi:hypothetical protein